MSKGMRNKERRKNNLVKTESVERKSAMILVPIIISFFALCVSCYMAYLQYTYAEADYEYKRNPKFDIRGSIAIETIKRNEEYIHIPAISSFAVNIIEKNNIDELYLISPSKEIEQVGVNNDINASQVEDYFNRAYKDKKYDLLSDDGKAAYFYRFILYTTLDDQMELEGIYGKTPTEIFDKKEDMQITLATVNKVTILELEKAHPEDPHYSGEKHIAEEYRELERYYNL